MDNIFLYLFALFVIITVMLDFYPKYLKRGFWNHMVYGFIAVSIILVSIIQTISYDSNLVKFLLDFLIYVPSISLIFYIKQNTSLIRINIKKTVIIYTTITIFYIIYIFLVSSFNNDALVYLFPATLLLINLASLINLIMVRKHRIDPKLQSAALISFLGYVMTLITGNINWWIISETIALINIYIYKNNILIYIDNLTGLYNRQIINAEDFSKQFHQKKLVLYYIDLNDFKLINDKYGHNIGDMLLKNVSEIFKASIRKDDYAIRLGGDEFLLVVGLNHNQNPKLIQDRINSKVKRYNNANDVPLSLSMGYEVYDCNKGSFDHHLFIIDQKMYADKLNFK